MEGHALGGGMLKLEPAEAEQVLIPLPPPNESHRLLSAVDSLFRSGEPERATELIDQQILRKRFALTASECQLLRDGTDELRSWRLHS